MPILSRLSRDLQWRWNTINIDLWVQWNVQLARQSCLDVNLMNLICANFMNIIINSIMQNYLSFNSDRESKSSFESSFQLGYYLFEEFCLECFDSLFTSFLRGNLDCRTISGIPIVRLRLWRAFVLRSSLIASQRSHTWWEKFSRHAIVWNNKAIQWNIEGTPHQS